MVWQQSGAPKAEARSNSKPKFKKPWACSCGHEKNRHYWSYCSGCGLEWWKDSFDDNTPDPWRRSASHSRERDPHVREARAKSPTTPITPIPKDKDAEATGRTVQDGDETLDLPKAKFRLEALQSSMNSIKGIPDMDDYKEHLHYSILRYESIVKDLTPKPQGHVQAQLLLKQWDKKQKEAQHLKKEYAETLTKLKALKIKRSQTHLDLSSIQTQWDELDTNLISAPAESGPEGETEATYMALDSDTEKDLRKTKRKLNPNGQRAPSSFLIRTPETEELRRPFGPPRRRAPSGDMTDSGA